MAKGTSGRTNGTSGKAGKGAAKKPGMADFRHGGEPPHGAKRKNNPPAGMASEANVPLAPKVEYAYNPHLPPVLRFDAAGKADALPKLIAEAGKRPLTEGEQKMLAAALRKDEPWLEWTGKREKKSFEVDPVALHIHERISTQAILKVAARQDVSKNLFADPQQEYHEAVQSYRHDIDWTNRLILGDSLQVMSSLAKREDLAGKVQMIYMDPPYGIKYASNFQPEMGKRDVKDKDQDLTREPEMVRAYRDTWHLGVHSYLSYLRDRLMVAKELLADTGSIFVQISDENLHRVRNLMDEVFGSANTCGIIAFHKTMSSSGNRLPVVTDYLLWYARDATQVKYRAIYLPREGEGWANYNYLATEDGEFRRMSPDESDWAVARTRGKVYRRDNLTSQRPAQDGDVRRFEFDGGAFSPSNGTFKTHLKGLERLRGACRLESYGSTLSYRRFAEDFPCLPLNNAWTDTLTGGYAESRVYVVQTTTKSLSRCLLMTTDPGDLVLDPTCGSGTTAYVAEQWGRRWVTIDTSRVALSIARQRLLTAKFEQYRFRDLNATDTQRNPNGLWLREEENSGRVSKTLKCKTVPHITLKSIAQNVALDPVFAKHEPILAAFLAAANKAVNASSVNAALRASLCTKYAEKAASEGIAAPTDADARRWLLPGTTRLQIAEALDKAFRRVGGAGKKTPTDKQITAAFERVPTPAQVGPSSVNAEKGGKAVGWEHWQVPFDTDPAWPTELQTAVTDYRRAWKAKMDEVNSVIQASAEQEELVDQPEIVKNVVRVSGPFTVESVQPPEVSLGERLEARGEGKFAGAPEPTEDGFTVPRFVESKGGFDVQNVTAYLDHMLRNLRADGVRFLNNRRNAWTRLEALYNSGKPTPFHAEGRWQAIDKSGEPIKSARDDDPDGPANVGVIFGPQYGPVTVEMVEPAMRKARKRYDHLVIVAFNFQPEVVGVASEKDHEFQMHCVQVAGDVNPGMNGLLKEPVKPGVASTGGGSLFSAIGLPRVRVERVMEGDTESAVVHMEGLDIYNPAADTVEATDAGKIAAWFLDSDYDGRTFCVTQAFFPDKDAWEKLEKALNGKDGLIDAERFAALSSTTSLPFPIGRGEDGASGAKKPKLASTQPRRVAVKVIDPRGNEVMAVEEIA